MKEKQIKHGRERYEIQEKLNQIQQALFPLHEKIKDSHTKYMDLKMKHEELSEQLRYELSMLRRLRPISSIILEHLKSFWKRKAPQVDERGAKIF